MTTSTWPPPTETTPLPGPIIPEMEEPDSPLIAMATTLAVVIVLAVVAVVAGSAAVDAMAKALAATSLVVKAGRPHPGRLRRRWLFEAHGPTAGRGHGGRISWPPTHAQGASAADRLRLWPMKPMSPKLQDAWDRFAESANFDGLHQCDLDRFAAFTATAHHPGRRKAPIDFSAILKPRLTGWEQTEIDKLGSDLEELYEFGRRVLAC